MNKKKIKLAMIGAGKMALWHLKVYARIPNVEIVAIGNPSSENGKKLAKKFKIPRYYQDAHEMIDNESLDAIDICTPTAFHYEYLKHGLEKGLHCYSEKPLVGTLDEAEQILNLNSEIKKIVFNGYNYRYLSEFQRVEKIIRKGVLGKIGYIKFVRVTQDKEGSFFYGPHCLGLFNEFHCHFVDLVSHWGLGLPKNVSAFGVNIEQCDSGPDTGTMILRYPDSMQVEITTSVSSFGLTPELLIIGDKGSLSLKYGKVRIYKRDKNLSLLRSIIMMSESAITIPSRVLKNPFKGSIYDFINSILKSVKSCHEQEAYQVLKVTNKAHQSYELEGKTLEI